MIGQQRTSDIETTIRPCAESDVADILRIINAAAIAYRGRDPC